MRLIEGENTSIIVIISIHVIFVLGYRRRGNVVNVTLGDVLSFITEASIIPPMGFDNKPLICFVRK